MEVYLVGGAVRDKRLGRPVLERDYVVVGATAAQLLAQGFKQVGKDFPIFLHPLTHEEYALARTERKTGPGYTGFRCFATPEVSLEDDLKRRDLTINALAETSTGMLIDPYGGLDDLQKRVLRHVSPAFSEDPVRILRVARFMARFAELGFTVADETMRLMQAMVHSGEIHNLVAERVWQEFARALTEPRPEAFIWTLRQCGALAVILPELDALFGIPNPSRWHPEVDSGLHTLLVLAQAAKLSPDPITRFAALTHDLGKASTPEVMWPYHPGHDKAGVVIIQTLATRLRLPKQYQALAILSTRYHLYSHQALALKPKTLFSLLERLDAFRRPQRWQQFLDVCEADFRGRSGFETKPYPQRAWLQLAFTTARQITVDALQQSGLSGQLLGERLRQQRILALKQLKLR